MKKILLFLIVGISALFTSCEKDKIGGTVTEKIAGEWDVVVSVAEGAGYTELGSCQIITYNTEENVPTEMWVNDLGTFTDFQVKVDLNNDAATFSTKDFADNYANEESRVKIIDGKVLYGAATSPSGMPVDSIVFMVQFSDDDPVGTTYKVSGFRHTGFVADDL